ncbi:sulfite reductase flavoprotein subunit alpha [Pseudomonas sp. 5P_3.1_Bac2]|uniref:sulfite reductase flavoprotein subunit alpha n=1 Tax=Pseudomonas sp. 5P_3.1_Bac2 TaxID=2971617 RepID=UPI0021C82A5B|nr:sulfite reductase flavoprotein subunit alpha [Pseudomonas sp. 5P_3.1_Bac2]MCU1718100.1 sulfite reductase flavoprotein subunit alpha [Pseudomonas sp. 5P_3.1_Bac2]
MATATLLRYLPLLLLCLLGSALLWLKPPRELSAALVLAGYAGLCLWAWLSRRQSAVDDRTEGVLIAYASQSGQAQQLAQRSLLQLQGAGVAAYLRPLDQLNPEQLPAQLLLILSTYGEGEAPDNGARFARLLKHSQTDLSQVHYAVLALGDRHYTHFCAFGLDIDAQLARLNGQRLFSPISADQCDATSLLLWQQQLARLSGQTEFSPWQAAPWVNAKLTQRRCLNPNSRAAKVFEIQLQASAELAQWQAGDLLEVLPQQAAEPLRDKLSALGLDPQQRLNDGRSLLDHALEREWPADFPSEQAGALNAQTLLAHLPKLSPRLYSIASLPRDASVQLLVRQLEHRDGSLGLGSGWLSVYAALDTPVQVRLRPNPSFHGPAANTPLLLIGNGTGLAGLRAHLRERPSGSRNWLIFGERSRASDFIGATELLDWQASGHLARLDLAFSQDQTDKVYVQHLLRQQADTLREWLADGAAIYLCGSLQGMGEAVHALLIELLGSQQVSELQAQNRYRRDLY